MKLFKVYSRNDSDDVIRINNVDSLEDMMKLITQGSLIKWIGEKKRYKCIARSENFIIVAKPYNLKKTFKYSIFDLTQMKCNKDNLVFGMYDYLNVEDCNEALEALENSLLPFNEIHENNGDGTYSQTRNTLEISQRGICNIRDVVDEIYVKKLEGKE